MQTGTQEIVRLVTKGNTNNEAESIPKTNRDWHWIFIRMPIYCAFGSTENYLYRRGGDGINI